ncbi:hypothetical protein ACA910_021303 [Epithemia clementina (nom. ined.)]
MQHSVLSKARSVRRPFELCRWSDFASATASNTNKNNEFSSLPTRTFYAKSSAVSEARNDKNRTWDPSIIERQSLLQTNNRFSSYRCRCGSCTMTDGLPLLDQTGRRVGRQFATTTNATNGETGSSESKSSSRHSPEANDSAATNSSLMHEEQDQNDKDTVSDQTLSDIDGTKKDGGLTNIPGTGVRGSGRQLAIIFTCTVCNTRSAKQFTENAYRRGVVLVRCPGCRNLHLIADRLGWFDDMEGKTFDIETYLQGKLLMKTTPNNNNDDNDKNNNISNHGAGNTTRPTSESDNPTSSATTSQPEEVGRGFRTVTNDNVTEITLEEWIGSDKMNEILKSSSLESQHVQEEEEANDNNNNIQPATDANEKT